MKYRFYIVGAYDLKIEHCLCAKNDTKYEDITDVYSHPQALSQCNNFLRNFDFTGINYSNTAFQLEAQVYGGRNLNVCLSADSGV